PRAWGPRGLAPRENGGPAPITPEARGERGPKRSAMEQVAEIELDDHQQAIARYYRECWLDYRFFWINRKNLGMHFGYWDEQTRNHAHSLIRTNEVMADAVAIGPGDRVLDAGCGVGGSSIWLESERGATVVGVNVSPAQVGHARKFVHQRRLDN